MSEQIPDDALVRQGSTELISLPSIKSAPIQLQQLQQLSCMLRRCPLCRRKFRQNTDTNPNQAEDINGVEEEEEFPSNGYFRRHIESSRNYNHEAPEPMMTDFGYYASHFTEIKLISRGAFGSVYICQHVVSSIPLGIFAVKKIPIGTDTEYLRRVLREVRVFEAVTRHPNVVEYNHSWVDVAQISDFGPKVQCLFILMEYACDGSLDEYVSERMKKGRLLSNMVVWYFFFSAVKGLNHLHRHGVLHRDIKPQNILLTKAVDVTSPTEELQLPRAMLSDFGTAAFVIEEETERTGGTGTEEYMAPELFVRDPETGRFLYTPTEASDVFSLGLCLNFLMYGGDNSLSINVGRPKEMVELVRLMTHVDPDQRPSCDDILLAPGVSVLLKKLFQQVNAFEPLDVSIADLLSEPRHQQQTHHHMIESSLSTTLAAVKDSSPSLTNQRNRFPMLEIAPRMLSGPLAAPSFWLMDGSVPAFWFAAMFVLCFSLLIMLVLR
eukprot:PhF_6_TR17365/c0_g1_i1/m.26588